MGWGEFITRIREHLGLNQVEFARRMETHPVTVSNWERDVKEPDFATFEKMLKLIDEDLTMRQCLVLPHEAPEAERKYRAIAEIIVGIKPLRPSPASAVPKPKEARPAVNRGRLK